MLRNHKKYTQWDARYMSNIRIWKVINDRAYNLQNHDHYVHQTCIVDIHLLVLAEYIVSLLPDAKVIKRVHKYNNDFYLTPDLQGINLATSCDHKPLQNADSQSTRKQHTYHLRQRKMVMYKYRTKLHKLKLIHFNPYWWLSLFWLCLIFQ